MTPFRRFFKPIEYEGLNVPVLSHHRAYGSVHGGSSGYTQALICLHQRQKAEFSEILVRQCCRQNHTTGYTPVSFTGIGRFYCVRMGQTQGCLIQ